MQQLDIYAEATVSGIRYQWVVYQEGDLARVDMFQEGTIGWLAYRGLEERLHGGTAKGLLEETVSRWLVVSQENGHEVRRTK